MTSSHDGRSRRHSSTTARSPADVLPLELPATHDSVHTSAELFSPGETKETLRVTK